MIRSQSWLYFNKWSCLGTFHRFQSHERFLVGNWPLLTFFALEGLKATWDPPLLNENHLIMDFIIFYFKCKIALKKVWISSIYTWIIITFKFFVILFVILFVNLKLNSNIFWNIIHERKRCKKCTLKLMKFLRLL